MALGLKVFFLAILASTHGYATQMMEKPLNSLERDILAVEVATNFGLTIKCLIDVAGDADTISAIYNALNGTVTRAQQIPADSLINKHYMDVVYDQTSLTVASLAAIRPVCASIASYCQHLSDFKEFASPQEIMDLQMYLSLTAPMAKCLMRVYGDGIRERIYNIFENAVDGIRNDIGVDTTPAQMVLLQAKYIGTELLKLDKKCKKYALTYNHCAQVGL